MYSTSLTGDTTPKQQQQQQQPRYSFQQPIMYTSMPPAGGPAYHQQLIQQPLFQQQQQRYSSTPTTIQPSPASAFYVPAATNAAGSGNRSARGSTAGIGSTWTPDPVVGHLLHTMRRVGPKKGGVGAENGEGGMVDAMDPEEEYEEIEALLQSRELNALVKTHNVILFCNQEQCPCVSNCCQIAQDVMEDVRPFALMIEECRELYAILTTPHIRVSGKEMELSSLLGVNMVASNWLY